MSYPLLFVYNQSSVLIILRYLKILYQVKLCLKFSVEVNEGLGMVFFIWTLLLFIPLQAKAENSVCRMMGQHNIPLIAEEGEVTIGALFPIHSIETLPSFEFTVKPQLLSCSRYAILLTEKQR